MDQPRSLLFIFVLFKQKFYSKKFSGITTLIVGVEGEYADHLTSTTTALAYVFYMYHGHF